uniref:Ubiquitin-like protease family profile domain-containing protein n=1 Tax=Oryza punctata TaxID=4537 RepID=A0A0E0M698_ORYPU
MLNPARYDKQTYMDFLVLVKLAHRYYIRHNMTRNNPDKIKLTMKTNWPCYKQHVNTNLCGYYMCHMQEWNQLIRASPFNHITLGLTLLHEARIKV